MSLAYISLGSNIGEPIKNLKEAVECIKRLPQTCVTKTSKIYVTEPVGYDNQNDFYNACIEVCTEVSAQMLMGSLLGIESALGRIRMIKNGPRVIDLDLLLYESQEINTKELTLPHPRMKDRNFVLVPLNDILEHKFEFSYEGVKESGYEL